MTASHNVIATELTLATGAGEEVVIEGSLSFDPADPFAITLQMAYGDQRVVWTFGRDLLANGLYEPTGDGDVHVWPCLGTDGSAVIILELCSPNGEILLQAPSRTVTGFLDEVQRVSPAGTESLDLDGLISQLLG